MNNGNAQQKIAELDTRTACIYLIIGAAILYLIMYGEEKAEIVDSLTGSNTQSQYPDTTNYSKIIAVIFIVVNSVFLYYAYQNFRANEWEQIKKGNGPLSDPYLLSLCANIFLFTSSSIALYNVFTNEEARISITR